MNNTIDIIRNRVSLRRYANQRVTKEEVDLILEGAMRAPTAGNMMLYTMLIVKDAEKKKQLSVTCDNQPFIAKAPLVIIFLADMQRWFDYFEVSDVKGYCQEQGIESTGPSEASLLLAANDAIIAAQNAVITAESIGIGSCYIGDIMENYEIHKEMFDLPDWTFPIAMLCFGHYPKDMKRKIVNRFDKKYIVCEDSYKRLSSEEFKAMMADNEQELLENNRFNAKNFGQFIYAKKTAADYSKEMTRSVKVALEHWRGGNLR